MIFFSFYCKIKTIKDNDYGKTEEKRDIMYQAGIYCRISIEERTKEEKYSNSIYSQIQMARDFIANHNDIEEVKSMQMTVHPAVTLTERNSGEC